MNNKQSYNPVIHDYFSLTIFLLVLVSSFSANANPAFISSEVEKQPLSETLSLEGVHYQVYCLEQSTPQASFTPTIHSTSENNYRLTYTDQQFDLKETTGFNGYFAPARWQKTFGDGGVDVTGAPNVALVEGANAALVKVNGRQMATLAINVPAEGYIKFDWRKIGGSSFPLQVETGDQQFLLHDGTKGRYVSPVLKAGAQLRLILPVAEDTPSLRELQLSRFNFYSEAGQVIVREWQANSAQHSASFTQYISLTPPSISNVRFPESIYVPETPSIYQAASLSPDFTGYPHLDYDGKESTIEDQLLLKESNCMFEVRWEDELIMKDNNWILLRQWQITDLVLENTIEKTQIIKLYPATLDKPAGKPLAEEVTPVHNPVAKEKIAIKYFKWRMSSNLEY